MNHATRTLLVLTGVALLVNYVETMVIPGIPTIEKDLSTTATVASWITSAYLIVGSAVSPIFGKLGDVYGKKRMFLLSLVFYILGVGIGGFAPTIYILIFARALQGIGFAIIPLGLAIITDVFPREKVATAQGIISGTFAIGAAAGLLLGSYVVQYAGWPYAFHSALVLSIILFAVSWKILKKDTPTAISKSIDYLGAAILMSGVSLLLLYATEGPTIGWLSSWELVALVSGAALTVFFFFFESKKTNPLIDLAMLRVRNVLVANLVGIISGITMFLLFFAVTYYTQLPPPFGLGLDVIGAGWTLAPSTLGMLAGGPLAGKITQKYGPRPTLLAGSILSMLGLASFVIYRSSAVDVSLDLILTLAGVIAIIVPIVNMIAISVPRENMAVGLGMNTMLRNLGGAIGPVVATSVMATYTAQLFIQGHPTGQFLPSASAFNYIFGLGIVLSALVFAISLATKNYTFNKKALAGQK
ncbi:MAG: MFS transporter [Nitrososphaerales archaeon]